MRITQFTDYSLRVLLYLGLKEDLATIGEIARAFRISANHLVKVVHGLSRKGYIRSYKGKNGGVELALDPAKTRIGDLISELEPMILVECFDKATNTCPIQGSCQLEAALHDARKAFIQSLNRFTLSDYLKAGPGKTERMRRLFLMSRKP